MIMNLSEIPAAWTEGVWTGMQSLGTLNRWGIADVWKWDSGVPVDWLNWGENEPHNKFHPTASEGVTFMYKGYGWKMGEHHLHQEYPFFCEKCPADN